MNMGRVLLLGVLMNMGRGSALIGCGIEMIAPMVIGLFIDQWLGTTPWFATILLMVGFVGGLFHIVQVTNQIEEDDKNGKNPS